MLNFLDLHIAHRLAIAGAIKTRNLSKKVSWVYGLQGELYRQTGHVCCVGDFLGGWLFQGQCVDVHEKLAR